MGQLPITGINHVCVVTRDLDRLVRVYWEKYGIGPWTIYRYDATNMRATLEGEPTAFEMRAGLAQLGPGSRIELIQPLDEASHYAESLRERGDADHLHHVRLDFSDYGEALAAAADAGAGVKMSAEFASGGADGLSFKATYVDTEADLGFLLELGEAPPGFTMPRPESVYPPSE
jgi:catechol 2,3-dioxygenase-like lactoylglutathione lyase family enzyme